MLRKLTMALGLFCAIGITSNAGAQGVPGVQKGPPGVQAVHDLCIAASGGGGYVVLRAPKIQLNCCPLDASAKDRSGTFHW